MLTVYIEQGFLDVFEGLPREKSYGINFLWELVEEKANNLFILDNLILNHYEYKNRNLTAFSSNLTTGNLKTPKEFPLENANLLFVTKEKRGKINTSGLIFTLEDFEQRIEEYAKIEKFIVFLQNEADWKELLVDFRKFPQNFLSIVDPYFFSHEDNTALFDELFTEYHGVENLTFYTETEGQYRSSGEKKNIWYDKQLLISKTTYNLLQFSHIKQITINQTNVKDKNISKSLKSSVNWHDREIVSDYAIIIAGIGFKKMYGNSTNNKLMQFNIFTKDGRHLINEQKEKFEIFESVAEDIRIYKY